MRPAVVAAAIAALAISTSAAALEGEPIRYEAREGNRVEREYQVATAGADAGALGEWNPEQCAVVASCVRIPIEIVPPPDRDETEDWIVVLEVDWNPQRVTSGSTSNDGNDLGIVVWHWEQTVDDEGNPEYNEDGSPHMDWVEVGGAVSASVPEIIKLHRPESRDYHLTVQNYSGVNINFTAALDFVDASYAPFDPYAEPETASGSSSVPATTTDSSTPGPATRPATVPSTTRQPTAPAGRPSTDLLPLGVDDDFAFGGRSRFNEELASGPSRSSLFERKEVGPPRPVSGGTILLWMGVVPLVVLAGAGAALWKFRPAALTIRIPAAVRR